MSFDLIQGKFVRGAAYSKEDEAVYLIEANHTLFALKAKPFAHAAFLRVEGADFLQQARIVSVLEREPVKHCVINADKEHHFGSRQYDVLTDAGSCRLTIGLEEIEFINDLNIECVFHVGYPPDDAKRLEDTDAT